MSVINQMLKDLQRRKDGQAGSLGQSPLPSQAPSAQWGGEHKNIYIFLLLAVLSLAVIASLLFNYIKSTHDTKLQANESMMTSQNAIDETRLAHAQRPAQLSSITQDNHGDHYTIILNLDKMAHYEVHRNTETGHVILQIDNARLATHVMQLREEGLYKTVVSATDDGIEVSISVDASVKFSGIKTQDNNLLVSFVQAEEVLEDAVVEKVEEEPVVVVSPEQRQKNLYQEALYLSEQGKIDASIGVLQELLKENQAYLEGSQALAILYLRQHNFEAADQVLVSARQYAPLDTKLVRLEARSLLEQGLPKEALATLHTLSPTLKDAPDFYALMAAVQQRLGAYLVAADLYQQLTALYPDQGAWWLGLGVSLEAAGKNHAGADAYKKAVATGTLSPSLSAFAKAQIEGLG